jgi:cytochrome c oxidase subunit 2
MEPTQYEQWLRTGNVTVAATNEAPEVAGARLFQEQRCVTCHQTNGLLGPKLDGVFGHEVKLQNGTTLIADETYVRESILNPQAKLVAGYPPVMPTFQGQLTEDALLQLIAYIKSLAKQEGGQPTGGQAAEAKPAEEKSGTEMKPPERQSEGQPDEGKPADAQPAEGQPAT